MAKIGGQVKRKKPTLKPFGPGELDEASRRAVRGQGGGGAGPTGPTLKPFGPGGLDEASRRAVRGQGGGAGPGAIDQPQAPGQGGLEATPTTFPDFSFEQIEKIKSGTLKANPEVTAAVMSGELIGRSPAERGVTPLEHTKAFLGIESLGIEHYLVALSGIGSLGRAGTKAKGATQIGKLTKGTVAANTKTTRLSTNWLMKIITGTNSKTVTTVDAITGVARTSVVTTRSGMEVARIAALIGGGVVGTVGTKAWAQHLRVDNLIGSLSIAARDARQAGLIDEAERAQAMLDDVLDQSTWDVILSNIAGINVLAITTKIIKQSILTNEINRKINDDIRLQQETGETEDDKWARIKQEEADQDKASIDYYNTERKKMFRWEEEARRAERAAKRTDEKKARNEDARFWAEQAELQRKLEAEERIAIANFWIAYRKAAQIAANDSRPSNLNFGLL